MPPPIVNMFPGGTTLCKPCQRMFNCAGGLVIVENEGVVRTATSCGCWRPRVCSLVISWLLEIKLAKVEQQTVSSTGNDFVIVGLAEA